MITVGGRDVGWLQVLETSGGAEPPGQPYVLPELRGRGIGTAIVGNLLARAGTAGKPVDLGVLRTNGRARALYERLGFRAVHGDGIKIHMRWAAGRRA